MSNTQMARSWEGDMAVVTATGLLYQPLEEETKCTGDDAERNRDERVRRGERFYCFANVHA